MTGPFLSVQEFKLHGLTWVNVAHIVKIQQSSDRTTIFLDGASTIQTAEAATALLARLEASLAGQATPQRSTRAALAPVKRGKSGLEQVQHG